MRAIFGSTLYSIVVIAHSKLIKRLREIKRMRDIFGSTLYSIQEYDGKVEAGEHNPVPLFSLNTSVECNVFCSYLNMLSLLELFQTSLCPGEIWKVTHFLHKLKLQNHTKTVFPTGIGIPGSVMRPFPKNNLRLTAGNTKFLIFLGAPSLEIQSHLLGNGLGNDEEQSEHKLLFLLLQPKIMRE